MSDTPVNYYQKLVKVADFNCSFRSLRSSFFVLFSFVFKVLFLFLLVTHALKVILARNVELFVSKGN